MIFEIKQRPATGETIFIETRTLDAQDMAELLYDCEFTNFTLVCIAGYDNAIVFHNTANH